MVSVMHYTVLGVTRKEAEDLKGGEKRDLIYEAKIIYSSVHSTMSKQNRKSSQTCLLFNSEDEYQLKVGY
jgi:hypothetical protein